MSREYDEYCEECKKFGARSNYLGDNLRLFQCLECGACYLEISESIKLEVNGTNEKTWKEAQDEAFEKYDKIMEKKNNGKRL